MSAVVCKANRYPHKKYLGTVPQLCSIDNLISIGKCLLLEIGKLRYILFVLFQGVLPIPF